MQASKVNNVECVCATTLSLACNTVSKFTNPRWQFTKDWRRENIIWAWPICLHDVLCKINKDAKFQTQRILLLAMITSFVGQHFFQQQFYLNQLSALSQPESEECNSGFVLRASTLLYKTCIIATRYICKSLLSSLFYKQTCSRFTRSFGRLFVSMPKIPLYDVLDHTNHTFSESLMSEDI